MTGYKKCVYFDKCNYRFTECIVELEIPDDAKIVRPMITDIWCTRNSSKDIWCTRNSSKLRCNKAVVKSIFSYDSFGDYYRLPDNAVAYSITSLSDFIDHFRTENLIVIFKLAFKYIVGETVTPEYDLDDNIYHECGSGIHFFEKIEEAASYTELWSRLFNIKDTFEYLGIILNE